MFLFLSKLLPLFIYPLGLACVLLAAALTLRRRRSASTALIVTTLLLLWLGGNRLVAMSAARLLEWQYTPRDATMTADAIVVLGGATRPQAFPRPTHEFNEAGDRLLYGLWLLHRGAAATIVLSGGGAAFDNPDQGVPEAEVMAEIMTAMGAPREALMLEPRSRNTYENAVECKKLLDAIGARRILLVTSAMHMPRSVAIFRKQGFDVVPAPTDFLVSQADWDYYLRPELTVQAFNLVPSADDLQLTSQVIKETVGILIYRLRGWL